MNLFLSIVCFVAIVWRTTIAGAIVHDRIKTRVPSPVLNILLCDSLLVIALAVGLLIKILSPCM